MVNFVSEERGYVTSWVCIYSKCSNDTCYLIYVGWNNYSEWTRTRRSISTI